MPMVANTMSMATETARAAARRSGNPSMMSVWALVAGTARATSSSVEAINAISALDEPAGARPPKPPIGGRR